MHVVERLLERQRAVHAGGIGAFQHQPLGLRLEPGLVEQRLQRHAGIHDVVDHAVRELAAVELRAAPFHAGIGRAFEEVDDGSRRGMRLMSSMVKTSGLSTRPLIISRCFGGFDLGDAAMMALEAEAGRRDDAVELVQRREVDRGFRRRRQPVDVAADDMLLDSATACHRGACRRRRRDSGSSPALR